MTITGGCHCGAITYTCDDAVPTGAIVCNCSICRMKGSVLHFTPPANVHFDTAVEPATYRWNREIIAHRFCPTCGIATHADVAQPGTPPVVAINLRTTNIDLDSLELTPFDGAAL